MSATENELVVDKERCHTKQWMPQRTIYCMAPDKTKIRWKKKLALLKFPEALAWSKFSSECYSSVVIDLLCRFWTTYVETTLRAVVEADSLELQRSRLVFKQILYFNIKVFWQSLKLNIPFVDTLILNALSKLLDYKTICFACCLQLWVHNFPPIAC